MALLGNYSVLNKNPGRAFAGSTVSDSRGAWNKSGPSRNLFFSDMDKKTSIPEGAEPPYSWFIAMVSGGLSARIFSTSSVNAYGVKGLGMETAIVGTSDVTAGVTAVVQLAAEIFGTSTVTSSMVGVVSMAATILGQGDLTAGLSMIASIQAAISGSGSVTADLKGKAGMSADIFVNSGAATTTEIVSAVWSAIASAYNVPGTMGAKLNGAASAGDPWSTQLPGAYADGEAGKIIGQIQTLVDELHRINGLQVGDPVTITPTSKAVTGIDITISGDGVTQSIIERT